MWHDNESEIDLINVSHLAWAVSHTIQDPTLLPVTIGVFGDWGSGKSSLLKLVHTDLKDKDGYLSLWFNGWLFEGYEDAKVALIGTILEEIQSKRKLSAKAKGLFKKLRKRINWFKVATLLGRAGTVYAGMAAGDPMFSAGALGSHALEALPEVVEKETPDSDSELAEGSIDSIRQFRKDFEELLAETKIETLVVFIDDLDRCLPNTVIETLEALRLFLYTPRSAYVIAADDAMIEFAVRQRFPEVVYGRRNVGRDYLEKLIQVPIMVPELSPQETENYINLLFVQHHVGTQISSIVDKIIKQRKAQQGELVLCDLTWLKEHCADITLPSELADDFALSQRIGDVLAVQLRGNPRQIKRFLNTLLLRLAVSEQRGAKLDRRVLAKLMVLEYADKDKFRRLGELQAMQHGKPQELELLETHVAKDLPTKPEADSTNEDSASEVTGLTPEFISWTEDRWTMSWLKQEPKLASIDLRPYYYVSRDAKTLLTASGTLPSAIKLIFDLLSSGTDVKVEQGTKAFVDIALRDALSLVTALGELAKRGEGSKGSNSIPLVLTRAAKRRPDVSGSVLEVLRNVPEQYVSAGVATEVAAMATKSPELKISIQNLLSEWSKQNSNVTLSRAAAAMLKKL